MVKRNDINVIRGRGRNQRHNSVLAHMQNFRKNFAFTLAEVLITLGIIGVVAAMVVPSLINSYQKHVVVTKLKQTRAILEQVHRMIIAEDGGAFYPDGSYYKSCIKYKYDDFKIEGFPVSNSTAGWANFCAYYYYRKYIKYNKIYIHSIINFGPKRIYEYLGSSSNFSFSEDTREFICYKLTNGADVCTRAYKSIFAANKETTNILVDINGYDSKPNKIGYDTFNFYVYFDGTVIPQGSAEYAVKYYANNDKTQEQALATTYYWRSATKTSNNGCSKDKTKYTGSGFGCTGRIFEEGKINYW